MKKQNKTGNGINKNILHISNLIFSLFIALLIATMPVASLVISNPVWTAEASDKVLIQWTTDVASNSTVFYDNSTNLNKTIESKSYETSHSIRLINLNSGQNYNYKILSCDSGGACTDTAVSQFNILPLGTTSNNDMFILLDSDLKNLTNSTSYIIHGVTVPDSKLTFYINPRPGLNPAYVKLSDNTLSNYVMSSSIDGKFIATLNLFSGTNVIRVVSEKENQMNSTDFNVKVDTYAPTVSIINSAFVTNANPLIINGITSESCAVKIFVNNESVADATSNGTFSVELKSLPGVSDAGEGDILVDVTATDLAGNIGKSETLVMKIDRKAPTVEWTTKFSESFHGYIYLIEGKTEAGATVSVKNKRNQLSTQQVGTTTGASTVVQTTDPLASILDETQTTAGDDGTFSAFINVEKGRNIFEITITDEAGNELKDTSKEVMVDRGSGSWRISKVEAYPNNVYFDEIRNKGIDATLFIVLDYVPQVNSLPYDVKVNGIEADGTKDNNDMVSLSFSNKQYFDKKTAKLYIYANVNIKQFAGTSDQLFSKLKDASIDPFFKTIGITNIPRFDFEKMLVVDYKISLTESYKDSTGKNSKSVLSDPIYGKAAYNIQKPEDLSKWLSPEMINKTIDTLDRSIKTLEKVQKGLLVATGVGLAACGVATFQSAIGLDLVGEESTYYVCDRVMCPSTPPTCGTNTYKIELENDKQYQDGIKSLTFKTGENGYEKWEFKKIDENEKGKVCSSDSVWKVIKTQKDIDYTKSENTASDALYFKKNTEGCLTQYQYDNLWSVYGPIANTFDYENIKQAQNDYWKNVDNKDIDKSAYYLPDLTSIKAGRCYTPTEPEYDNTRCFGQSNSDSWINPREGVIDSVRCGCLPGMYGYTTSAIKVLKGMEKCMKQVQVGEINGGFCERMFLQYTCDIASELFVNIIPSYLSDSSRKDGSADDSHNPFTGLQRANDIKTQLSDRYGDSFKSQFGMSSDSLVNKMCMFAFTGEIDLLEGALQGFVKEKPVAPWGVVRASSRQAGYDPFSGRMRLDYNIFVGVVAGGDVDVEIKIVCDKNFEGGEYCQSGKIDEQVVRKYSLNQQSDMLDENIYFSIPDSKYWYNKVVMTLLYKLDSTKGYETPKVLSESISKKSSLAEGCTFGADGFTCSKITIDDNGYVQLYSKPTDGAKGISEGTKIPAGATVFYPGNKVSLLAKINNRYNSDFYLYTEFTNSQSVKYPVFQHTIPANFGSETGEDQYYFVNLMSLEGAVTKQTWQAFTTLPSGTDTVYLTISNGNVGGQSLAVDVEYYDDALNKITNMEQKCTNKIQTQIPTKKDLDGKTLRGLIPEETKPDTDNAYIRFPLNKIKYSEITYIIDKETKWVYPVDTVTKDDKGNYIYEIKESLNFDDTKSKEVRQAAIKAEKIDMKGVDYIECFSIKDKEKDSNIKNKIGKIIVRTSSTEQKPTVNIYSDSALTKLIQSLTPSELTSQSKYAAGSYNLKVDVLKDVNGVAKGDQQILGPTALTQEQTYPLTLSNKQTGDSCTMQPTVEIIEPILDQINLKSVKKIDGTTTGADSFISSVSMQDDCDQLQKVGVKLVRKEGNQDVQICEQIFTISSGKSTDEKSTYPILTPDTKTGNCIIEYDSFENGDKDKLAKKWIEMPPYYKFIIKVNDNDIKKEYETGITSNSKTYAVKYAVYDNALQTPVPVIKEKTFKFNNAVEAPQISFVTNSFITEAFSADGTTSSATTSTICSAIGGTCILAVSCKGNVISGTFADCTGGTNCCKTN